MKKIVTSILVLTTLLFSVPSFAFTDLCETLKKTDKMTTAQLGEFYDDNLKHWRVEGKGKIIDVFNIHDKAIIYLYCTNKIRIRIDAGQYQGSKTDLNIDQEISFTGNCTRIRREFYPYTKDKYVTAYVNKSFLDY